MTGHVPFFQAQAFELGCLNAHAQEQLRKACEVNAAELVDATILHTDSAFDFVCPNHRQHPVHMPGY